MMDAPRSKSEAKRRKAQGALERTHYADEDTLVYIAKLEQERDKLEIQLRHWAETGESRIAVLEQERDAWYEDATEQRGKRMEAEARIAVLEQKVERLTEVLHERSMEVKAVVDEQANDEGLWFEAVTASEAYLQTALRRLHTVVECGAVLTEDQNVTDTVGTLRARIRELEAAVHIVFDEIRVLEQENERLREAAHEYGIWMAKGLRAVLAEEET